MSDRSGRHESRGRKGSGRGDHAGNSEDRELHLDGKECVARE